MRCALGLTVLTGLCLARSAGAQERLPANGGQTVSLGQPGTWQWTFGGSVGLGYVGERFSGLAEGRAGVYHELLNPVLGLGGLQLEGYSGAFDTKYNSGLRLRFMSPVTGIALGADYNVQAGVVRPMLTYVHPVRRGGISGNASVLRADVLPGRRPTLMIGIEKPVFRRIPVGSNRPQEDHIRLKAPVPPEAPIPAVPVELRTLLATARDATLAIGRLTVPWLDHTGAGGAASDAAVMARLDSLKRFIVNAGVGSRRTLEEETRRLHAAIDRAFSLALVPGDSATDGATSRGHATAQQAREILLREIILPYNRLLGQLKIHDTTRQYAVLARGRFLQWLLVEARVSRPQAEASLAVFSAYLEMVESARAAARHDWRDSRFVWIPLQMALRPEQHDTQEEIDTLVAEATREPFTEGNVALYLINDQFQYHLSRTIREARDYHVLLTHDFRGLDAQGDPDEMSFRHVLGSYLAALTARVRAYDSTGTFPVYFILFDEWFYDVNKARLWMDLLEDPTRHEVRLPPRFKAWEDSLRVAQDSLRAAIRASTLLTVQRKQYGEGWLQNMVKVHVNITNSADPSFWSWKVAAWFPVPDAWMRDHRKIVFYDLAEEDPYRGEAIFTGAGIGEHYANLSWEDRSILVRGPAVLGLKAAARDVLLKQGIINDRMSAVLQSRPRAPDYDAQVRRGVERNGRPLRAMQLQNGTGFDAKGVNIAKAMLYTLMPAGSVITIPDALWNSAFWGSALLGGSLRGVRVMVIAPALPNAPAKAFGSIIRGRELLWRLLAAGRTLATEIEGSGGLLKVGIFASDLRVTDVAGKTRAVKETFEQHRWLRDLFAFPAEIYTGLEQTATNISLAASRDSIRDFESVATSQLHMKANFFASREAWTLFARADWTPMTAEFGQLRLAQVQRRSANNVTFQNYPEAMRDVGGEVLQRWYDELTATDRERVVFFTILGSSNQNDRSITIDGEDAFVIAKWPSVIAYLDLITLIGQSWWLDEPSQVYAFLPSHSSIKTRLAHWWKLIF